jgi:hypothetical protein
MIGLCAGVVLAFAESKKGLSSNVEFDRVTERKRSLTSYGAPAVGELWLQATDTKFCGSLLINDPTYEYMTDDSRIARKI